MRFRAFLSYSHTDAESARWLLRRLESYRVPSRLVGTRGTQGVIERHLGTFFRDREELPSASDLGESIREALTNSEALIVVCSPAAAQSRWVNAEIEAFQTAGRGDRVHCFVVAGQPGSADPAQDCFPPALIAANGDGVRREPLAADARPEGDGRERAFLKLAAGLLGVGYDTLAQREVQRRARKLTYIAAASLAGMVITTALAVSAYVSRNDAQRRQAQAEDILGFMLGDLREKLTTVGRLDLMRAVDDKATNYFSTLDPRDMNDRALEEQARSLTGIGQVRLDEGNHEAASRAFREAHARSAALYERTPGNGQRLFDLAQAEYWVGFVSYEQGNYDLTEIWFRRYRDSALRLAAMDRSNFDWQLEVAYALQNMATLDDRRGRYQEAERAMAAQLDLYRGWVRQRPDDLDLRYASANVASWLGSLALRQGNLEASETYFQEQVRDLRSNLAAEPLNVKRQDDLVVALQLMIEAQTKRGRHDEARKNLAEATVMAEALHTRDAKNNTWRLYLARNRWWQAQVETKDVRVRTELVSAGIDLLTAAHRVEPENASIVNWLTRALVLRGRLALQQGDLAVADTHAKRASQLAETAWSTKQIERLRPWLAEARLLNGDMAQHQGDHDAALKAWRQAKQVLLEGGVPLPHERLEALTHASIALGEFDESAQYRRRLNETGYVPLRSFAFAEETAMR